MPQPLAPKSDKIRKPRSRVGGSYAGQSAADRRQQRYQQLLEAGIEVIGRAGFAQASIDAICAEAGLTKRYFYESFKGRAELMLAAYGQINQHILADILQRVAPHNGDPSAMIRVTLNAVLEYYLANPSRARIVLIEILAIREMHGRVFKSSIDQYLDLALRFTRSFLPKNQPEPAELKVMALGAIGSVNYLSQRWVATGFEQDKDDLLAGVVRIFDGIAKELGISGE